MIQRAASAANLITNVLGWGHYDVTMPTYTDSVGLDEGTLVSPYIFTTPAQQDVSPCSLLLLSNVSVGMEI